jgi:hypothetical protein
MMPRAMAKKKPDLPASVLAFFRAKGREGGLVGGQLRWKGRTRAERSAHTKLMVAAREAKRAKNKKKGR